MVVESSSSTATDATASAARNFSQSAGCSMEQIFTPIAIVKGQISPTPGFAPPYIPQNEDGPFGKIIPSSYSPPANKTEDFSSDDLASAFLGSVPAVGEVEEENQIPTNGSVGPTIHELNPYFPRIFGDDGTSFIANNDYNVLVHDGTPDLNLKKNPQRPFVQSIRTQALRGPLILSGWGFDIADLPVPNMNDYQFNPNMINQRSYWKTGPVHLMWDDQRQVWAGCYQVVCGYLSDDDEDDGTIEAPTDPLFPTVFKVKVLRRTSAGSGIIYTGGEYSILSDTLGEKITCVNRDINLSFEGEDPKKVFVVAIRINYEWVPLWVSVEGGGGGIFIGTFSGSWGKGSTKSVTRTQPSEAAPVSVINLFADVGAVGGGTSSCAYTKIGQSYYLIAAECAN